MRIEIQVENTREWCLVELQGVVEGTEVTPYGPMGTLQVQNNIPFLTIGNHKLEGSVVKLKKPYAILRKNKDEDAGTTGYGIVGVVRHKYLFSHRPQPLLERDNLITSPAGVGAKAGSAGPTSVGGQGEGEGGGGGGGDPTESRRAGVKRQRLEFESTDGDGGAGGESGPAEANEPESQGDVPSDMLIDS